MRIYYILLQEEKTHFGIILNCPLVPGVNATAAAAVPEAVSISASERRKPPENVLPLGKIL